MFLVSLTLLSIVGDRNQISSLVYAVCPGVLPVLIVITHNKFVALCKQEEFVLCVRITAKNTFYQKWFNCIWEFKSKWLKTFVLTCMLCNISALHLCNLCGLQSHIITFPRKASHSGAHPPVGMGVGAMVALTKSLLLLQTEGSSIPQFMSFQYPVCAEFTENNE